MSFKKVEYWVAPPVMSGEIRVYKDGNKYRFVIHQYDFEQDLFVIEGDKELLAFEQFIEHIRHEP